MTRIGPNDSPPAPDKVRHSSALDLTFRAKLLLGVCALVVLTGGVITLVSDRGNRASTNAQVDSLFHEVSGHAAEQTKGFVERAAPVAESLSRLSNQGLALDNLRWTPFTGPVNALY
jgi:hypothetical protein